VGFRVDAGAGRVYDAVYLSERSHDGWSRHLRNAHVSFRPRAWRGLQLDVGKWVSSAGAEVTESHLNWNYSRSLLFALGPCYHAELRASVPWGARWTAGGALVTGWNSMRDNNTGRTMGFTSTGNFGKVVISNTFYTGPENTGTNRGWRHFYDSVVTITPSSRLSMSVNLDVGRNRFAAAPAARFRGVATAAKVQLSPQVALGPRFGHYSDTDGFWTGSPNRFREFTLTAESKLNDCLLSRLELRKDWSSQPFFQASPEGRLRRHRMMLVAGRMIVFRPGMLNFPGRSGR